MDIKDIIKNLEHYNNWRRDNDDIYTMPEPKQIGLTIDAAISELNKLLICDVVSSNVKISNKSIKKKRPEILINQIWESNIRDDFYKVLSTTNNKVELVNIKNVWDMKIICKESLHNYFTLQIKSE